jgi:hypothetical protein
LGYLGVCTYHLNIAQFGDELVLPVLRLHKDADAIRDSARPKISSHDKKAKGARTAREISAAASLVSVHWRRLRCWPRLSILSG